MTARKRRTVGGEPEGVVWTAPRLLSRADAAEYLGVSPSTLDGLVRDCRIEPIYLQRKPLFPRAALDRWADMMEKQL
jgi:excisionase family DNA binding protein